MSEKLSREQFIAQWGGQHLAQIKAACEAAGHKLKARDRNAALEEAWHLYSGKLPEAGQPVDVQTPTAPELPPGDVVLEGRSKGGRPFYRAGQRFDPQWTEVKLSPAQLEIVRKEPMVQLRVKA